jgi:stage II sporulation protein E
LLSDNLKEMARIIRQAADEQVKVVLPGEGKKKQISRLLSQEGLILKDIWFLEKEQGRKEVVVRLCQNTAPAYPGKPVYSAEEVAAFLSVLLNLHLVPASRTPYFVTDIPRNMVFVQETRYTVLTGYAKGTKEEEKVSGDNYSFFETEGGYFTAVLSDGMGSGSKACRDSELVVEMAERLLDAGFTQERTAQMINDALIIGGEEKNMSTLDMCSINLHTGEADFIKIGAALSLIRHDSYVERVSAQSLPLGVFHEMDAVKTSSKLMDGDYLFLFSDGIVDSFPGTEGEMELQEIIRDIPYRRPSEMAAWLMRQVIRTSRGKIRDDMTVLVIGVWENGQD